MDETCDACHRAYQYSKDDAEMHLYIDNPECNHISVTCTHCGAIERIYARSHHFLGVMHSLGAGVSLHAEASPELQASAARTWEDHDRQETVVTTEDLPEAPKDQVRQLMDDLRNWRGEAL